MPGYWGWPDFVWSSPPLLAGSPSHAIFFPLIMLSTRGIIMPMETPLKAEEMAMHSPASPKSQAWGITNLINLTYRRIMGLVYYHKMGELSRILAMGFEKCYNFSLWKR